jgi:TonB family protein
MTSLAAIIAGCFFLQYPGQALFAPWKQYLPDLEKRAVAETQRIIAQELDPELPRLPFSTWFKQVVGPQAGTVWQLSECGETAGASKNPAGDIRACVEANSILPDGRKVFVMIAVGTFKKGMTGAPAFHSCVVEQVGKLRPVRRLRDLPKQISVPGRVELPEVNLPSIRLAANNVYLSVTAPGNGEEIGWPRKIEEPPPEPPPNRPRSSTPSLNQPQSIRQVVDKVLEGNAITRVEPTYPPTARMMRAFGTVRVQITISETGKVIDAKAISGHQALRSAAVDAAYKWVFKPTTVNGEPIKVQGALTFNFRSSP